MNMRTLLFRTLFLAVVSLLVWGCASSRLELELAIYNGDPLQVDILTKEDIDQVRQNMTTMPETIDTIARLRARLAQEMFDVYDSGLYISSKARDQNYSSQQHTKDMSILNNYLGEFKTYLGKTQQLCLDNFQSTMGWLKKYGDLLPETIAEDQTSPTTQEVLRRRKVLNAARQSIVDLQKSMSDLAGPSGTKFETTLQDRWLQIVNRITSKQVRDLAAKGKNSQALQELDERARKALNTLGEAKKRGLDVNQNLQTTLKAVIELNPPEKKAENIEVSLPNRQTVELLGDTVGKMKKFDLFSSQVERLQDPSDAVWKIVTDPINSQNWNVEFSRTYYRAEGKTSVVIVRDSPMEFRVQQSHNNPAALVQAQLQISRAVADAAITVIGATTGVNLSAIPKPGDSSPNVEDAQARAGEELARRKAKVARLTEQRGLAIKMLSANLRSLREQLGPLKTNNSKDKITIEKLLNNLVATLKADAAFFDPKNKDANDKTNSK
jgi:hypothetical protein